MDPVQHPFVAETGQPSQRRRKARLACNPCRARKTGCDGRKPVCTACSLRGWDDKCGYPDSVMQPSAALTLVDLDRRLQKLEHDVRSESDTPRRPALGGRISGGSSTPAAASRYQMDVVDFKVPTAPGDATTSAQVPAPESRQYRNPTAGSESPDTDSESPTFPDLAGFSMQVLDQPLDEIDPHAMVLPPRHFADELLRWYWRNMHPVFPFLHWPMFEGKYRSLWKQQTPPGHGQQAFEERLYLATLNMVLAQACFRYEAIPLTQRQQHADEFYKRSLRLVSVEALDTASIPVVQLLLLRAMYLYFSGRADRCWLISGAAIRVAIGLGLHLTPRRPLNQLEREVRRRVWYAGCVPLDQIFATTFGRPGIITPNLSQPPLPQEIDEEYLSAADEGRQPDGLPSRMAFIIFTKKYVAVMDEMRAAIRAPRIKIGQPGSEFSIPDPSALLQVNSRVDDLLDGLPMHLRAGADLSALGLSEDTLQCFRVQGQAVRFRTNLLRVFLLRPSLLAEAQRWAAPGAGSKRTASAMLQERLHYEICSLCLATVHTVLEEVHTSLVANGAVSAWYALHFTFASATVLLVATLSPNLGVSLDVEPTKSSWDRALAIFDFHKPHVASAARGLEVLQRYCESITQRARARSTNATGTPSPPTVQPQSGPQQAPPQDQQQQTWQASHAMPTPPSVGVPGLMEGLDEFLVSDSLDEAWLSTQDFGQGDWMLHC